MQKISVFILSLLLILSTSLPVSAAKNGPTILINQTKLQTSGQPFIHKGTTFVPLRDIFETLGATVTYNGLEKTIDARLDERTIQMTIGATYALVNGQKISLQQPAVIKNNTTFVPLRFISESFGHVVYWNQTTRTVTIKTDQKPVYTIKKNTTITIGSRRLNLPTFVVEKNTITFVPLTDIVPILGGTFTIDKGKNEIIISNKDQEAILGLETTRALVDGEMIHLTEAPINFNGDILVPLRFVGDMFNSYVNWDPGLNEISIHTPTFKSNFLIKEQAEIAKPTNVTDVTPVGHTRLMISDHPETLNEHTIQTSQATLWHDMVKTNEEHVNHRVFGWHVNDFNNPIQIAVTIENLSNENDLTLTNSRGINKTGQRGWVAYDVGLPLAELILSNDFKPLPEITVEKGSTKTIQLFSVSARSMVGFINEFTVTKNGSGQLNYNVRVVMSKLANRNLTTIKQKPVELIETSSHSRGTWPFSSLQATLPTYTIFDTEKSYNISNGITDNLFTAETSNNKEAGTKSNIGHFGATYIVKIPINNPSKLSKKVRIRLGSRGGMYAGAIKAEDNIGIILGLKPGSEVANIRDYVVGPGETEIELELTHAGGSNLPVAINVSTVR